MTVEELQTTGVVWADEVRRLVQLFPKKGIFLTGIESSDPWVEGKRRSQLKEAHNFHQYYEKRLENIRNLGITWLRFGPPYSETHTAKASYDFSLTDNIVQKCEELGIELMIDLLHFGLPEWLHAHRPKEPFFQNPDFPFEFAEYVRVFTQRYPHIRYFTLINEPFITANFSTKLGFWNESVRSQWNEDTAFVRAVGNIAKAAILAKQEIVKIWEIEERQGLPIFIQNESFEIAIAEDGAGHRMPEVNAFNLRRFAALDLIFGHYDPAMKYYLESHGMPTLEYDWFMDHGDRGQVVLGIDHYPTCVHRYHGETTVDETPSAPYKLYDLVQVYWDRYQLPMLHTETNAWPAHAVELAQKTYDVINRLRQEGYPIVGMGWYGDEYQVGWHFALYGPLSFEESPVGLFYKGELQPVGKLFSQFAKYGLTPL
jgi:beta-glucosidase/6-phospho-beta-glucosidase/beta-galactosidase